MNKCYYCNNSPRGCAECRKTTVLDMGDNDTKSVLREPIDSFNSRLMKASWEDQCLYFKCVQHEVDQQDKSIFLELVREPSRRFPVLMSRTQFDFLPYDQRSRCQMWSLNVLDARNHLNDDMPELLARHIVDFWCQARARAVFAVNGMVRGDCPSHGEYQVHNTAGCPLCLQLGARATINVSNLKVPSFEFWKDQEPNVYPQVTDAIDRMPEMQALTEQEVLHGSITGHFNVTPEVLEALRDRESRIQAWFNGSWDDVDEDDMDIAAYWGSRAGGNHELKLRDYEIRLRSLNDVASRIADHWVKLFGEEMVSDCFSDNEPKD